MFKFTYLTTQCYVISFCKKVLPAYVQIFLSNSITHPIQQKQIKECAFINKVFTIFV